ncbi:MFS transporter [Devosia sp.]|uniref:MFS transporter n=1 Tax=Devosia sp. TaxID=1871048 RepID=UPI0037BEBC1A
MSIRSSLALFRVPSFAPVLLAILLASLAEAVAGSYMALLAVAKIGMSPLELSAFLTLSAVSGIVVTTVFGQRHDRNPVMWPLLVALVAKAVGYGLCAVLTETWMLLLNAFFLFGLSSASFALLFAIAKGYLDRVGGAAVQRGMAALRLTSSLAWAIGPALGAGLVAVWSFEGVFAGAAVLAVLALGLVIFGRIEAVPADLGERAKITLDVVLAAAPAVIAMTAFHLVMFMGSNAMSIVVIEELGTATDVGLLFSLCAALEVLVMAVFVVRPVEGDTRWLLLLGFALFALYFVMPIIWPTLASLYWGQIPRAIAIGIISVLGMAYIQGLLPGRAGIASALFGNTMSAGFLLSGLGTGLWAEGFGYWSLFIVCAVVSLVGGAVLFWPKSRRVIV